MQERARYNKTMNNASDPGEQRILMKAVGWCKNSFTLCAFIERDNR